MGWVGARRRRGGAGDGDGAVKKPSAGAVRCETGARGEDAGVGLGGVRWWGSGGGRPNPWQRGADRVGGAARGVGLDRAAGRRGFS